MMNEYRKLVDRVRVPSGLNEKVMAAVSLGTGRNVRYGGRILRAAVCAVCVMVLVMGSFSFRWEQAPPASGSGGVPAEPGTMVLSYTFGLQASAAERCVNGSLIILWEDNCGTFRVSGENISSIRLETDRGILLRNGEKQGAFIAETYDADVDYAIAPEEGETLDTLNGAVLSLTAVFVDGSERSVSHRLTAEKLRMFWSEDGREELVPALDGDNSATVTALYGTGAESRWLSWPVRGSNTVSLSRSYGKSLPPGGGEPLVHAGIDIPGTQGLEIAAAENGLVTEAGYSSHFGNYLVLDHGDGLTTLYAHCRELLVTEGQQVKSEDCIALMGSTGMSTGPHLHFEVRQDGEAQNPVAYFPDTIRDTLQAK